jgi:tetratricopeptide (TPR) repeat protein
LKRFGDAVAELERASELVDDDLTIKGHLADAYMAVRDYTNAIRVYKLILQAEPDRKDIAEKIKKARGEIEEK